jgi:hypothetical protein
MKALGLAVAVQLVLLPFVFAAGFARRPVLPLPPLAAVAGGRASSIGVYRLWRNLGYALGALVCSGTPWGFPQPWASSPP